jgi:hypothetical protein
MADQGAIQCTVFGALGQTDVPSLTHVYRNTYAEGLLPLLALVDMPKFVFQFGDDFPLSPSNVKAVCYLGGRAPERDVVQSQQLFYLKGVVTVSGLPYDAKIRVYRRDNGRLLVEGRSNAPVGKFQVSWAGYNGLVYWMVFDDSGSPIYNAKVLDLVQGV